MFLKVHLKKKLGQHFLVDQNIINKLIKNISHIKQYLIILIGAVDGALSR